MKKNLLLCGLVLAVMLAACGVQPAEIPEESAGTMPPPSSTGRIPAEESTPAPLPEPTEEDTQATEESQSPSGGASSYDGALGSAGSLRGTTVLVSIYADDAGTSWDFDRDAGAVEQTLNRLSLAAGWLTEQAALYGAEAEFVCDWSRYDDLRYTAHFEDTLVRRDGSMYVTQEEYILQNIDSAALKEKYHADNIVYFFFFNTAYSNPVNPWSLGYSSDASYHTEFTNLYVKFGGFYEAPPATYAHELLHAFGAHDLYYASRFISQDYVDFCKASGSDDIMFTVNSEEYISSTFTELDAYYTGIAPRPAAVDEWDLLPSEYEA